MENNIIILILLVVLALLFTGLIPIILIIIFGVVILYYYNSKNTQEITQETTQKTPPETTQEIIQKIIPENNIKEKFTQKLITSKSQPEINNNFMNMKFHTDYRDVSTAINNIVAEKQHEFNANANPTIYSEPNISEIMPLITNFMNLLNENIRTQVPDYINANTGWDEQIPYPNINFKSGWDKAQEALGLLPSLYDKPAPKNSVELIKIKSVEKYETNDEIKYIVEIIIQKINVEDQMVLCIHFIQNKKDKSQIIIENIFIVGYLTKYVHNINREDSDVNNINDPLYYDYNQLDKDDILDPKYVRQELTQKYEERIQDMKDIRNKFDDETKEFYDSLYPIN